VRETARYLRVGEAKVRHWIRRGDLRAINTSTALCGRPRWIISQEALAQFERARSGGPAENKPRKRKRTMLVDYYPDE
jgi:hypothetical protein